MQSGDTLAPRNRRQLRKKKKQQSRKKPAREPNELEKMVARGVSRVADVVDAGLEVFERDPERAVNATISFMDGVGKIGAFIKQNPDEAKRVAASIAVDSVNKLSHAFISAGARQIRKDLNGKRKR